MKPYIRKRSDFIGSNPIAEENKAGVLVVREGNKFNVAVEMDPDTVVWVDQTQDNRAIPGLLDSWVGQVEEIREQFKGCRPD